MASYNGIEIYEDPESGQTIFEQHNTHNICIEYVSVPVDAIDPEEGYCKDPSKLIKRSNADVKAEQIKLHAHAYHSYLGSGNSMDLRNLRSFRVEQVMESLNA